MTRRSLATLAAVLGLALVSAACAGDGDEPDGAAEPAEDLADDPEDSDDPAADDDREEDAGADDDTAEDAPGDATGGSTALLDTEVQTAIDDAVERTGVDRDQVEVVTTELVTWPDGSVGCPEPDQMYTMALVDGYRIVLEVDGDPMHYHGADGSPPGYCADPRPPAEGGAGELS